mgnify:FL=1
MRAYINGIGLLAPGMEGLDTSMPVLAGDAEWVDMEMQDISLDILPANERRRTTRLIKYALYVASMATDEARAGGSIAASVFASSDGDTEIVDKVCESLCHSDIFLSPTLFHNSVHNAPAGYWAIATGSHAPSTSISAADNSFSSGLMESMIQLHSLEDDVLFVAYDCPPPPPLDSKRNITMPFAVALMLGKTPRSSAYPSIQMHPLNYQSATREQTRCQSHSLEQLRCANPAARSLPLLESICRKQGGDVVLPYGETHLIVSVEL